MKTRNNINISIFFRLISVAHVSLEVYGNTLPLAITFQTFIRSVGCSFVRSFICLFIYLLLFFRIFFLSFKHTYTRSKIICQETSQRNLMFYDNGFKITPNKTKAKSSQATSQPASQQHHLCILNIVLGALLRRYLFLLFLFLFLEVH